MIRSGALIYTSGKGGVGKTPLALLATLILAKLGKKVVAVDYNFHNPDLYEIFSRMDYENVDVIDRLGNDRLIPPLRIFSIKSDNLRGEINVAVRLERYRYSPYPPVHIFKSLLAIREYLGDDFFSVIDTNLNPVSFYLMDPESYMVVKKVESEFDSLNMVYLLTPSVFSRSMGLDRRGDIDLLKLTVNSFLKYGSKILGKDGENIIYLISPTVYDFEAFYKTFAGAISMRLKSLFGKRSNIQKIELIGDSKDYIDNFLRDVIASYIRSTRKLSISDLEQMRDELNIEFRNRGYMLKDFIKSADAVDVQSLFISSIVRMLYDPETNTFPRNTVLIPYILKSMINFVDVMLLSEHITPELVISKQYEIMNFLSKWLEKIYLEGL